MKRNLYKKILLFTLAFILLLTPLLSTHSAVNAQSNPDFEVNSTYSIKYDYPNDYVQVTEQIQLKVNNREYKISGGEEREIPLRDFSLNRDPSEREFKRASLQVKGRNGLPLDHTIIDNQDGITIKLKNARDIDYFSDERITISYNTHELINHNGNVVNLYIPALPRDTKFTTTESKFNLTTKYTFNTQLDVSSNSPEHSYTYPSGKVDIRTENDRRIYTISAENRLGETAWIQLGTTQYYYFKMVQPTPKTDRYIPEQISKYSDLISTNIYKLPLPKEDSETGQRVFFSNISPHPKKVEVDSEGNYLATFEVPANRDGEIVIEGYITMQSSGVDFTLKNMPVADYLSKIQEDTMLTNYTLPDEYWETNSNLVMTTASDLLSKSESLVDLINNNYNFIIDRLEYSYEKVNGDNQRLGALATLEGAPAVCMEYSDTLIALFRAQGIPARAAIGYGNDPTEAENKIGEDIALAQNIGHQWLQIWIPEHGWLSIDPTWGESGRRYIGPNLDHILWYTVGDSKQGYVGTSLSTADPVSQHVLSSYDVYLRALSEQDFQSTTSTHRSLSEVVSQYESDDDDFLSTFIKTTSIGKVAVIVAPIALLLMTLFVLLSIISAIFKSLRSRRAMKGYPPASAPPTQ